MMCMQINYMPYIFQGHDVFGFDLDVFLHRIEQNKVPHWSKVGRLKRAQMPRMVSTEQEDLLYGLNINNR